MIWKPTPFRDCYFGNEIGGFIQFPRKCGYLKSSRGEGRPLEISFDQTKSVPKDFQNWPLKSAADLRAYPSCLLSLSEVTGGMAELAMGILLIQSIT